MNAVVTAALKLAGRGLPVFACSAAKAPVTPRGFKAATTDPAAVRRMFSHPAAAMIGVPTGHASGVNALDIDPRHGGHDWLAAHVRHLPETRTHATPSGGRHLLLGADPRVRCSAGRIAPGVDVRGEGGYVIVPPSPGYAVINAAPVAPWPAWLLLPGKALPPDPPPRPVGCVVPEPISDRRLAAFVSALLGRLAAAPDGCKHSELVRCGRTLGGIVDAMGMPESEAVERLLGAVPPTVRDWQAARKTASWAVASGRAAPIALTDRGRGSRHG